MQWWKGMRSDADDDDDDDDELDAVPCCASSQLYNLYTYSSSRWCPGTVVNHLEDFQPPQDLSQHCRCRPGFILLKPMTMLLLQLWVTDVWWWWGHQNPFRLIHVWPSWGFPLPLVRDIWVHSHPDLLDLCAERQCRKRLPWRSRRTTKYTVSPLLSFLGLFSSHAPEDC